MSKKEEEKKSSGESTFDMDVVKFCGFPYHVIMQATNYNYYYY